ncbi:hypothetical protein CRI93_05690 [Longimonas halophila]|uniref:MotA/TolQ/ExbB proton channel domain-containing protein n=1 Tax=Longimonas halophila TaxID=1469170 RepID=A0A2H3NYR3_9BACT|nr:MotA/TolQ/ExbB proton channel family protein [Longimonas halophila]PEN07937.1 hypothetical protein CRI93_05690 [Longimonas halophila]
MFGIDGYLVPIIGYLILYAVFYFAPLIYRVATGSVKQDTNELKRRIDIEVTKERRRHTSGGTSADDADAEAPEDAQDAEEADASTESDNEEPDTLRSRTLESSFSSPMVSQAVQQLKTRFPDGDYRTFDIEQLPAYGGYIERLSSARSMAGIFVLMGLLGTLWKLNEVVQDIGEAAGTDTMEATAFLDQMGLIMTNIGGAFLSTIWGLVLMVSFLIVTGLLDRWRQRHIDYLDETMQTNVVPGLVELQRIRAPNLSMGDLIEETSGLLTELNTSVEGLTTGMKDSLADLSGEINTMMQDFGSFQRQYAKLDEMALSIKKFVDQVEEVADAIKGAGHTLANPISEMNRDLNHTIREHMAMVGDAIDASQADRDALASSFKDVERNLQRTTAQLRDVARDSLEDAEAHRQRIEGLLEGQQEEFHDTIRARQEEEHELLRSQQSQHTEELERIRGLVSDQQDHISETIQTHQQRELQFLEKQQERHAQILEEEMDRIVAMSTTMQDQLQAVAEALESANNVELSRLLETLDRQLSRTTSTLDESATTLAGSAEDLRKAARRMKRHKGPVTLFDATRRSVYRARDYLQKNGGS